MGQIILGRFMIAAGCFSFALWLESLISPHSSFYPLLIAALLCYFGWRKATSRVKAVILSPPPVPRGFNPTQWHQNIALDATAGKLWFRDENEQTRVFSKKDVTGWDIDSKSFGPDYVISASPLGSWVSAGRKAHFANRLIIKTTDLDHPVYAVKFNYHSATINAPLNRRDVIDWVEKLNAFARS